MIAGTDWADAVAGSVITVCIATVMIVWIRAGCPRFWDRNG